MPAPGVAVPLPLEGAGDVVLNPDGNVHCAMDRPQTGLGVAGALFTVRGSVAKLPVSSESMNRWLDVFV